MRILFFTDHFRPEPSAPAAHVFERARLWVKWGHDVTVICSAPNFPEGKVFQGYENKWRFVETMEGIKVVRVKTFIVPNQGFTLRILDYMSYMVSAFFFSLFENKPDVVISTSPHIFVSVAGVIYSLIKRVPHVMEVRDLWPASIVAVVGDGSRGLSYRLLEKIELWLYKKSTRIISLTQSFVVDMLERGVPQKKIDIVVNGANLELFSPRPKDAKIEREFKLQNRFVIGYLGTLGLAHGLKNVINTARLFRNEKVVFFFVGVGAAKKQLQEMVVKEQLDNVIFVDRQEKEAMPDFLSVCDVSLIHLKNADVFKTVIPSKIFEAAAMGLPVLFVGPKGEGSDIVEKHEIGIWVKPDSPDDFAAAVQKLMDDMGQVREMGLRAREIAPLYSRDRQAKDSLMSLKHAISKNSYEINK
jgi:colanic acid biosynthesis glycosyl transferase WcaI